MVTSTTVRIATRGQGHTQDISSRVQEAIAASGCTAGLVTVFVVGSTAGVTTIEFEPGAVADFDRLFGQLAPRQANYQHHLRWGDDNGSSHVRAALLGPSLTIPFVGGRPTLGTWQQVVVVEFDTRPRERDIVFQIIGE